MLADAPFLRHRILGAAFVGVAAIAKERQDAVQTPPRPPLRQCVIPPTGFELVKTAPCEELSTAPHATVYYIL